MGIFQLLMAGGVKDTTVDATGGSKSTDGDYTVHVFNTSGNFVVNAGQGNLAFLCIGGGGGTNHSANGPQMGWEVGGGGAGAYIYKSSKTFDPGTHPVSVGDGGSSGGANPGSSSSINLPQGTWTAPGGGGAGPS